MPVGKPATGASAEEKTATDGWAHPWPWPKWDGRSSVPAKTGIECSPQPAWPTEQQQRARIARRNMGNRQQAQVQEAHTRIGSSRTAMKSHVHVQNCHRINVHPAHDMFIFTIE